jgi:PAS domain S-box-containing protein/putative nucleotidyltransferase with HDIG domain
MKKNGKIDFTEIKNLSEKVQNIILKEKIFNHFLPFLEEGISLDYNGFILYCNDRYAEIFGYRNDELIGKSILTLYAPGTKDFWERNIREGREGIFETYGVKKDGKEIYLRINVKNIDLENKKLRMVIIKNITSEKLMFKEIKETNEKYKILAETLLDGIVIIDLNGKILFSNTVGANLLGFERVEDTIGKDIFQFIKEKDLFKNDLKLIYENKGGYLVEYEIKDNRGSKFVIESIGQKSKFNDQDAFVLCFRDITQRKLLIENLKKAVENNKKVLFQAVKSISDIMAFRDPYTSIHQKNVAKLAVKIAKEMGFSKSLIDGIEVASLLHDIGKVYIPTDILLKPGKLSKIEWEFIKMHPIYGVQIVKNIEFPWDISKIILQHHERLDGSGYPQGLKNGEILLEAKILSVADVVEAMTSVRPYKMKYSINETLEEIKKFEGIFYDKDSVRITIEIFKKGFNFENAEEGI